jgi:hypothetical protein
MSRGKKKALIMKAELGKAFEKLPVHERRTELLARSRGTHSPFYIRKILKRGSAAVSSIRTTKRTQIAKAA